MSCNRVTLHVSPAHLKALDHPAARPVRPSRGSLFISFAPLPLCYAVGSSSRSLLTVAHSFPPPSFAAVHVSRHLSASLRSVTPPASPLIPPPPKDRRTAPQGAPQTPPSKERRPVRLRRLTSGSILPLFLLFSVLLLGVSWKTAQSQVSAVPLRDSSVQVFFSPRGGCTEAIIKEINQAKTEILVQAYSFTSSPIAKALIDAHKRGIRVIVVLDKSQRSQKYSSADFTAHAGIPTFIDAGHAIAHNKVMVIDKAVVITGSFNFTKAAEEKNAENLLIIRSKELAQKYIESWEKHKGHSERYEGR